MVFEIFRRIFGPIQDSQIQEWGIMENKELNILYDKTKYHYSYDKKINLGWTNVKESLLKAAIYSAVERQRRAGHPRIRWRNNVDNDKEIMCLTLGE